MSHLRQGRLVEVQLQPHDHIWEISGVETHDVFGDPCRAATAARQQEVSVSVSGTARTTRGS